MRVVYSEETKGNLVEIAEYTQRQWGKTKRMKLIKQIADSVEIIAEFPRSAKFDVDLGLHYKLVPQLPLVIVYAVETDFIRIIKILHTKRDR